MDRNTRLGITAELSHLLGAADHSLWNFAFTSKGFIVAPAPDATQHATMTTLEECAREVTEFVGGKKNVTFERISDTEFRMNKIYSDGDTVTIFFLRKMPAGVKPYEYIAADDPDNA